MITQRPLLCSFAIFSVLMVLGFYLVVFCQRPPKKAVHLSRNAAGKLRRAKERKGQGSLRQRKVHNGVDNKEEEKKEKENKKEKEKKEEKKEDAEEEPEEEEEELEPEGPESDSKQNETKKKKN